MSEHDGRSEGGGGRWGGRWREVGEDVWTGSERRWAKDVKVMEGVMAEEGTEAGRGFEGEAWGGWEGASKLRTSEMEI